MRRIAAVTKETDLKKVIKTGEKPGRGCYVCTNCGQEVDLGARDKMPPCPRCSNNEFTEN